MPSPPSAAIPRFVLVAIGLFGTLLASFPARNLDLWSHLAAGRELFRGGTWTPTWLFDLASSVVMTWTGGLVLVAIKALTCGSIGIILLRRSATSGWRIALAVTGLAIMAVASRFLLQPQFLSVLFLTLAIGLTLSRDPEKAWPGAGLVILFMAWANIDSWFVLGLATVALIQLGRRIDDRRNGTWRLSREVVAIVILVAVSTISVNHVFGFQLPAELNASIAALRNPDARLTVHSPFDPDFLMLFRDQSTALAYFPLLALSIISFGMNRPAWSWSRFFPWLLLAVVSGIEARTIPFFAVVAGPITAWNLQEYFDRHPSAPSGRFARATGTLFGGLIVIAFLVAAWPGWLQGPPYEPRRWSVDCPSAIREGAEWMNDRFVVKGRSNGVTLHASSDVRAAVSWWCPGDKSIVDDDLTAALLTRERQSEARRRLAELGIHRAVVWAGDPRPSAKALLDRLLGDENDWRLVRLTGGLAVLEWNGASDTSTNGPARISVERSAFQPTDSERVPLDGPRPPRPWWTAFWQAADEARAPSRDEAAVLLRLAEASRSSSVARLMTTWESSQLAGLIGASSSPGLGIDAVTRLTFFRPPLPEKGVTVLPPMTEIVFGYHRRFAMDRGALPFAHVLAAMRAARRAVAENPDDANAHFALGQTYSTLANLTAENRWSSREGISQLRRVRHVQASFAYNRAIQLNPRLAAAHRDLALLYRSIGCLDLALEHSKAYRELPIRWGGPPKLGPEADELKKDFDQLSKFVGDRIASFEKSSAKSSVSDRALLATQMELGGVAQSLLLKSDVSAFGQSGVELEVDLLLRTGRPRDVLDWTTPEVRGSLGDQKFHWTRAQALLALGDYAAADIELGAMIGPGGTMAPASVVATELAPVVGKNTLDGAPTGFLLGDVLWFTISRNDLERRSFELAQTITLQANMTALRGLIALEAGTIDRAKEDLTRSLSLTPSRYDGGQLDFNGRRVAWDVLSLLESVDRGK